MGTLTRYILAELGKVFLFSLIILTAMMLIVLAVQEALSRNLPPTQVVRLIPYLVPFALTIAVPVTLLLATTYVYGRMAGSNEVVAIKSLGIFPLAIVWPVLIVAFLLSLGTVWLNDLAFSWGRNGVQRVVIEAVEEIAHGMLRTQRQFSRPNFIISVKRVEGRTLIRPILALKEPGSARTITIIAEKAKLGLDREENMLEITLTNATAEVGGEYWGQFSGKEVYKLPLADAGEADPRTKSPSSLPLCVIPNEIKRQQADIQQYQEELAVRAAYQMLCGDFPGLAGPEWKIRHRELAGKQTRLCRLRTEPHRRWSAGFSCLCFVFVGAPMAIWLRHRDFLTSFFLCFAPILAVYYPAMVCTVDAAKCGRVPAMAVWAGNVMLVCWGAYLLRKVIRY